MKTEDIIPIENPDSGLKHNNSSLLYANPNMKKICFCSER
jgi:hypothetical protein